MCYQCISVLISWNNLFELCEETDQKFKTELEHKTKNSIPPKNALPKKIPDSHQTVASTTVNSNNVSEKPNGFIFSKRILIRNFYFVE